MLRFRALTDPKAAYFYFTRTDSGLDPKGLRCEVGGKGAERLGLSREPDFEQFKRLLHGLDPHTGEQLTAKLIDGRLAGWDVTASVPKGVTLAIEGGDERVHDALWEAGREAMADLEAKVTTRVRRGEAQDDRVTGNLIYYGWEHGETRPNRADGMPDPDRHIHFVIPNVCFDDQEHQWKAVKFRPLMDLRKYFDRRFDLRLSGKLADLGYPIETKYKPDERGGKRYFTWDIEGMPASALKKFSRRGAEVDTLAEELGIEDATRKDKLGATSRLHKRDDLTMEDYRAYWSGKLTTEEGRQIASTIHSAMQSQSPRPENTADKAVAYAIAHEFYHKSVLPWHDLAVTAMERCMGGAKPDDILPEARKQGVLLKDGQATTKDVLAEESRIIAFAREGRGTMRPLAKSGIADTGTLSPEQQAANIINQFALSAEQAKIPRHIWGSEDRLILVRGAAGTGKTHTMKATIAGIDRPVAVLAPSVDASRVVLREDFPEANTVAAFLMDKQWQQRMKGGVIYVDEAGLLPIKDLAALSEIASQQHARIILQGDPKQHRSVARHGNLFHLLQEYAGLPVAELKDIRRQSGAYKDAIKAIDDGDRAKGLKILDDLGWIHRVEPNGVCAPVVEACWDAMRQGESFMVIGITHKQNDAITAELRKRLRAEGKIGAAETALECLQPLAWTDAQKGDIHRYDGSEVLRYHHPTGSFKAGQHVRIADWQPGQRLGKPEHYAVYSPGQLDVSAGDVIRATASMRTKDGHRVNNGAKYAIRAIGATDITLDNGWVLDRANLHIAHGLVDTSYKVQGKGKDRVIAVMTEQASPAMYSAQFYVDLSRGKKSVSLITDMPTASILDAVKRQDSRMSATELLGQPPRKIKSQQRKFRERMRERYEQVRDRAREVVRHIYQPERTMSHAR